MMPEQTDLVHDELSARLRMFMNHHDHPKPVTQTALAAATGFTEKHISQVLNGHAAATTDTWSALLAAARPAVPEPGTLCRRCRAPLSAHLGMGGRQCPRGGVVVSMETGDLIADLGPGSYFERATDAELHAQRAHPGYEYTTTEGPRKAWADEDRPPEGEGWERNTDAGRNGWDRFDYTEEAYWRRQRPPSEG